MKKIVFLTPCDVRFGFGLAGIEQRTVDLSEASEELDTSVTDPATGLVIIDERLVRGDVDEMIRERERSWNAILLVLPSPEQPPPEIEDYAARMIRRAIGYHVRLNV
jgi:vacuolar-type H+-ATPase subunit F/Vma7